MKQLVRQIMGATLLCLITGLGYAQVAPIPLDQRATSPTQGARDVRQSPQTNAKISESQAVALARQRFVGNILRISLVGEGVNQRYQIRMENEGKVFTVFVQVATGKVTGGN